MMSGSMTPEEIYTSWRDAKNPAKQIKILAELNATTPHKIKGILIEQGAPVDQVDKRMQRAAEATQNNLQKPEDAPYPPIAAIAAVKHAYAESAYNADALRTKLEAAEYECSQLRAWLEALGVLKEEKGVMPA